MKPRDLKFEKIDIQGSRRRTVSISEENSKTSLCVLEMKEVGITISKSEARRRDSSRVEGEALKRI